MIRIEEKKNNEIVYTRVKLFKHLKVYNDMFTNWKICGFGAKFFYNNGYFHIGVRKS